jgi:hypothetical protein
MPVIKTMRECYEVRDGKRGEDWADITLRCWDNPPPPDSARGMYYGGEIAIHSSFGTWGYNWSACGVPFKQFLIGAEFRYLFTKFMGTSLDRFDGDATLKQIRADILSKRNCGGLDKREAREAWDAVGDEVERLTGGATDYGYAMFDVARGLGMKHPMRDYFADPCEWPRMTHDDHQAQGFWRTLWPLFVGALKTEVSDTQPALQAA